ncbi:hypothetical protein U1Q18_039808 [Sarracenia purpurea var. burkii]
MLILLSSQDDERKRLVATSAIDHSPSPPCTTMLCRRGRAQEDSSARFPRREWRRDGAFLWTNNAAPVQGLDRRLRSELQGKWRLIRYFSPV